MPKPTGPTNPVLVGLIEDLKAAGHKHNVPFAIKLAEELSKPERIKVEVNLTRIERNANKGETIVVPGKVLGDGELKKPLTIAAANFSMSALEKISKAGGKALTLSELIEKNPKGTDVKILC